MACFSEDLFDVFEEKSEPVSLSGKKRRRESESGEHKKPKVDTGAGSSMENPVVISGSQETVMDDEGTSKDEEM